MRYCFIYNEIKIFCKCKVVRVIYNRMMMTVCDCKLSDPKKKQNNERKMGKYASFFFFFGGSINNICNTKLKANNLDFSMLLQPLLNGRTKSMIGDKIAVFKLHIRHWRSIMSTVQPSSQSLCFISKTICCHMWILHDFLQVLQNI